MTAIYGITGDARALDIKQYYRALNSRTSSSSDLVVGLWVGRVKKLYSKNLRPLPNHVAAIELVDLDLLQQGGIAEGKLTSRLELVPAAPLQGLADELALHLGNL